MTDPQTPTGNIFETEASRIFQTASVAFLQGKTAEPLATKDELKQLREGQAKAVELRAQITAHGTDKATPIYRTLKAAFTASPTEENRKALDDFGTLDHAKERFRHRQSEAKQALSALNARLQKVFLAVLNRAREAVETEIAAIADQENATCARIGIEWHPESSAVRALNNLRRNLEQQAHSVATWHNGPVSAPADVLQGIIALD